MGVLLFLLSLLVAVAGAGRYAVLATRTEASTLPYYASSSELNAYWQSVSPNIPIPLAILDHFSAPSGNERKDMEEEHYSSIHLDQLPKGDAKISHNWFRWVASEKLLYPEDVFTTAGSRINLYIGRAAALRSAFLRRDIAESTPVTTKNFTDVVSMFAPAASLSMARDMWSTLRSCEHPSEVAGEQKACAASVESMRDFASWALGTGSLRAFSTSLDVPEEGISSPPHMYEVAVVRAVTTTLKGAEAEANTTVTCHGMSFPFALFYCHAVNPTRIYEVTLRREEDGNAVVPATTPVTVRALAVCHLNTSGFDPTLRYWVKLDRKPGETPVWHFLTRGDVLWVPAGASAAA